MPSRRWCRSTWHEVRGRRLRLDRENPSRGEGSPDQGNHLLGPPRRAAKLQEQAGKANARLNSQEARSRADDLQARLEKRLAEFDREAQISALPPVVLGGLRGRPARADRRR